MRDDDKQLADLREVANHHKWSFVCVRWAVQEIERLRTALTPFSELGREMLKAEPECRDEWLCPLDVRPKCGDLKRAYEAIGGE